ncbi:ATPase [Paenibacillus sedimenti]|uniref:ATPase n=1 Tax=Paenibacillus sedimenti TaxID=2770274 RepID=A0A926QM31_9BACL|nr:ATPase [Paenibacillus sedimenti]MBD0384265.1 ATPase [Paenibacillus sedimenti]
MLRLGEKIIIIADSLEQNLPIGQYGYIIAYDRNADNIFDYVVRIPKDNKHYYVTAGDIELEEVLLQQEAERIEKEALIDYALSTKNEEMFRRIMNGDSLDEVLVEQNKEVQSREDFIKQVGLKAWI